MSQYPIPQTLLITAGLVGLLAVPAQAETFDNTTIQFSEDTIVEFEFVESNGAYRSCLGVMNVATRATYELFCENRASDTSQPVNLPSDFQDDATMGDRDDFQGSPGTTVPNPVAEFQFDANTPYALYLNSMFNNQPAGTVYSTNALNPGDRQQVLVDGGLAGLAGGGTLLRWDDTGSVLVPPGQQDRDFDDFVIRAGGHLACALVFNSAFGESAAIACDTPD